MVMKKRGRDVSNFGGRKERERDGSFAVAALTEEKKKKCSFSATWIGH